MNAVLIDRSFFIFSDKVSFLFASRSLSCFIKIPPRILEPVLFNMAREDKFIHNCEKGIKGYVTSCYVKSNIG